MFGPNSLHFFGVQTAKWSLSMSRPVCSHSPILSRLFWSIILDHQNLPSNEDTVRCWAFRRCQMQFIALEMVWGWGPHDEPFQMMENRCHQNCGSMGTKFWESHPPCGKDHAHGPSDCACKALTDSGPSHPFLCEALTYLNLEFKRIQCPSIHLFIYLPTYLPTTPT